MSDYILVTAAHNEEKLIDKTIHSVINQQIKPTEWIIVNDGSTDDTENIVNKFIPDNKFIKLVTIEQRTNRSFASKVNAINTGLKNLSADNYNFIGILDADVSFEPHYYSSLINKFNDNSQLGIAGGKFFDIDGNKKIQLGFSPYMVRGATQFFRRRCFESIGGLTPMKYGGYDTVACNSARMNGWKIENFTDLIVLHHRPTGTAGINILKTKFRAGRAEYHLGFHPIFQLAKCISRSIRKPLFIGSLFRFIGFWWAYVKKEKMIVSRQYIDFVRKEQLSRLFK